MIETAPLKDSHGEVLLPLAGTHILASFQSMRTMCGKAVNGWGFQEIAKDDERLCPECSGEARWQ